MPGPWEKYQSNTTTEEQGPWTKYSQGSDEDIFNRFPKSRRESLGAMFGRNLKEAAKETYRETVSPILSGISTAALGVPKAIAQSQGSKETIYPEQQTVSGKLLRGISEAVGFFTGGAVELGEKVAAKAVPKLAAEGLGRKSAREAVHYGIAALSQTPEQGISHPASTIPQRVAAGATGAAAGAVGPTLPAMGTAISKGAKYLWDRSKADYLTSKVAPVAEKLFKIAVSKFSPIMQGFARVNKIPESSIQNISQKGAEAVLKRSEELGDNTDTIYQRIEQGFANKEKVADDAYAKAMSQTPTGYAQKINIGNTARKMKNVLQRYGMVNAKGMPTKLSESESLANSQQKKLLDIYTSLQDRITAPENEVLTIPQMERFLKTGVSRQELAEEIPLTKDQYTLLRDNINVMYKDTPYDRNIAEVADVFYSDGENAGLKGLQDARRLQREHFEAMSQFINKNTGQIKGFGERNLDRYHTLTGEQKRGIQDIANYIGDPKLVSDLSDVNSAKHIQQLTEKFDTKYWQGILNRAVDRGQTEAVRKELSEMMGQDEADSLIEEVIAHRKAGIAKKAAYWTGGITATAAAGSVGKKAIDLLR